MMKKIDKKCVEQIFSDRLKVRNKSIILSAVGLLVYNLAPEVSELGCWMIGLGMSLGVYLHYRIKKEANLLFYGELVNNNGEFFEVKINGDYYTFPSSQLSVIGPDCEGDIFSIAVVIENNKTLRHTQGQGTSRYR